MRTFLFSYGTLQLPRIQQAVFGKTLEGTKDSLIGYQLRELPLAEGEELPELEVAAYPIIHPSGDPADCIEGVVLEIDESDLLTCDEYEGPHYTRIREMLQSGISCWVYVGCDRLNG